MNGLDTISLVLYYAPVSPDSLHQIQLTISGFYGQALSAKTIPFRLKPGPLDSIQIEDIYKRHLTQPQTLTYPTGTVTLYVAGFDQYGNRIEPTGYGGSALDSVLWRTDGTLHRVVPDSIGNSVYYSATNVMYDENGNMRAMLLVGTKLLKDSLPIRIVAAPAKLDSAVTRDINGNGLIDRIDLIFDKNVDISRDATGAFIIRYGIYTFVADSIIKLADNSYAVYIKEQATQVPQTSWLPVVTITNLPGVENIQDFRTNDGCPPVVWRAIKHITSDNRSQDTVRLYFSEKITGADGGQFSILNQPFMTFYVWVPEGTGFRLVDSMLVDITSFTRIDRDSIIYFAMTNGYDLTDNHYINFRTPNPIVKDQSSNQPTDVNQKVKIQLEGSPVYLYIFPNPSNGTFRRKPDGVINLFHERNARPWVDQDKAGVVIGLTNIRIPPAGAGQVAAYLKIYDVVGNIVNWAKTDNLLLGHPSANTAASGVNVDIYWNGSNQRGMLVAPGVYRVVVYIDYPASTGLKDARLIKKAGIGK
jgi:hypothetical protein